MTVPVVSASNNVNQLLQLMRGQITRKHRIAPATYDELTYQYQGGGLGGGTSENHDMSAAAADLTAAVYGWALSAPLSDIAAWAEKLLATKAYLQKEGSLLSPIYFEHHTFEPGLVNLWAFEALAAKGDDRFDEIAAGWRSWLRAGVLWAAVVALPVKQKSWSAADRKALKIGPGVAVAQSAPVDYAPPVSVAACGLRGWDLLGDHSWYPVTDHGAIWPLAEFGMGLPVGLRSWAAQALFEEHRWKPNLFTAEEQVRISAAVAGDIGALNWIESELVRGGWMPLCPVEVIRAEGGVTSVILDGRAGATSALVAKTVLSDGTAYAMGVDSPHRGSPGNSYNRKHTASVDIGARVVTAQAILNNVEGYANPVVKMPAAPGPVYFHRVYSQDGVRDLLGGTVTPPATPAVTSPVPPEEPAKLPTPAEFFRSIHNKAGLSDPDIPGTASYFLRTTRADILAWCKGLPYPWAIELFHVQPDGSLRLLSEAEMVVEDRTVRKYRSLWDSPETVGVQWAPGKTVTFALVRHGWDAPGETEAGPFTTKTATAHTPDFYERVDYMAVGTPDAYSESYVFGAHGPQEWSLVSPTETKVKSSVAFKPALSEPILLFGVFPDERKGWIWSEGGPDRVIYDDDRERRPTMAVFPAPVVPEPPKKEKATWIERMGL